MATRTAVQSGLASATATWGGTLPVSGDTIVFTGYSIQWDMDCSGWADGLNMTGTGEFVMVDGGYFKASTSNAMFRGSMTAGSAGTPFPYDEEFIYDVLHDEQGLDDVATEVHCYEPTNKYVQLSAAEASGQTVLSIDTDLTSDLAWKVGDTVSICGERLAIQITTIAAISATELTVNDALTDARAEDTFIALLSRNIKFLSTGSAPTYMIDGFDNGSTFKAELQAAKSGLYGMYDATIGGTLWRATIGTANYAFMFPTQARINSVIVNFGYIVNTPTSTSISQQAAFFASGTAYCCHVTRSGLDARPSVICGFYSPTGSNSSGEAIFTDVLFKWNYLLGYYHSPTLYNCIVEDGVYGIYYSIDAKLSNCTLRRNSTADFGYPYGRHILQQTPIESTTATYNCIGQINLTGPFKRNAILSYDCDGVAGSGNHRAWMRGGTIVTQSSEQYNGNDALEFDPYYADDEIPCFFDLPINGNKITVVCKHSAAMFSGLQGGIYTPGNEPWVTGATYENSFTSDNGTAWDVNTMYYTGSLPATLRIWCADANASARLAYAYVEQINDTNVINSNVR